MTVYFHGTFGLKRSRLAGLLKLGLANSEISDDQLAKPFGYRKPFTQRYRSWLHKTGLAELRLPIRLTDMGKVIYDNDPELNSMVSQWFMHRELIKDETRVETWHFFINEFLARNRTFSQTDLINGLMMKLSGHSEKHFGPESKLNKVIARTLINCYTKNDALGDLHIIDREEDKFVRNDSLKIMGHWKTPKELARAFAV